MSTHPGAGSVGSRRPTAHELARRALFAFLLTFILARALVFLIMAHRIPNLYLFLRDTHVHHLNPLSSVEADYEIDPIQDLRPVCPNCHAVLHRREPPYSLDEVREFLRACGR